MFSQILNFLKELVDFEEYKYGWGIVICWSLFGVSLLIGLYAWGTVDGRILAWFPSPPTWLTISSLLMAPIFLVGFICFLVLDDRKKRRYYYG